MSNALAGFGAAGAQKPKTGPISAAVIAAAAREQQQQQQQSKMASSVAAAAGASHGSVSLFNHYPLLLFRERDTIPLFL